MNGAKTGFGTKKWKNGAQYEGEWQDNHINGFGFYYWPKGTKNYKGYYAHDQIDGFGVMEWVDGRKFRGFWDKDKKVGFGIHHNTDGSSISATWFNNKLHGYGVYESKLKVRKFGAWKHGKKIATLSEEEVQALQSGKKNAQSFIEATDEEWEII